MREVYKEDLDKFGVEAKQCVPKLHKKFYNNKHNAIDIGIDSEFAKLPEDERERLINDNIYTIVGMGRKPLEKDNLEFGCYGIKEPTANENSCPDGHSAGIKYVWNWSGRDRNEYHYVSVCHKNKVQDLYNSILDDPDKIVKFFKLIFVSLLTLIVTAIIGTCYEFWLRYGESLDCMYYKTICKNIGSGNGKTSIIDYHIPNKLYNYPYQECIKIAQSGGKKMKGGSNEKLGSLESKFYNVYHETGERCITLDYTTAFDPNKPFPYNIADFAEENFSDENIINRSVKLIIKTVCFFYLFPMLYARKVLNPILKFLSTKYQTIVKNNAVLSNLVFMLLSGLMFPIIAYFTGFTELTAGPLFIILGISSGVGMFMGTIGLFMTLISVILPNNFLNSIKEPKNYDENKMNIYNNIIKKIRPNNERPGLTPDYYSINPRKFFWSLEGGPIAIAKNIICFPFILIFIMLAFTGGLLASILASIWMNISIIIKFFYIPLSQPLEFFYIIKEHGHLLTILFCMGVIGASSQSLNPTTTGIMSGILAVIALIKIVKGLKKSVN